jgi:two-component system response regulator AtoC
MPIDMQVKLLRVLQQKEFRRVGGTESRTTDARVLSASNRNLEEMVRAGSFREDLWYRLNVVEIYLPPLRQRRGDLPLLVEHLLRVHGGSEPRAINRTVLATLLDYDWPGNVRELENEIQRAVALSDGEIRPDAISAKLTGRAAARSASADRSLKAAVDSFEREAIRAALHEHGGKVAAAARALGLTRAGLYKKLHRHGLTGDK